MTGTNKTLLANAVRFYREDWEELLECVHCVNPSYTTTEANKLRIGELIEKEQSVLDNLKELLAGF